MAETLSSEKITPNDVDWNYTPAKSCTTKANQTNTLSLDTLSVTAKLHRDKSDVGEPIAVPIYHSATYKMTSLQEYLSNFDQGGRYSYSRLGNVTCETAECTISDLEGGVGSLVFSSGMAAGTTVLLHTLKPGDHIVACLPLYSGIESFIRTYLPTINVTCDWVSGQDIDEYRRKVKPNTKLMYGESPCNPCISVIDLAEFGKLGKELGILTIVDSTFASPYLQQPIKHGVDIVMHSCSKYIGGHSDLVAGCLTFASEQKWKEMKAFSITLGNILSPFDAYLIVRGLKTLPLRMTKHSSNALHIATYLDEHPKVSLVHYPGLVNNPFHQVAKKQMKSFSGMVSFELHGGAKAAEILINNVKVIHLAVSLGGVESLIEHPASMTHAGSDVPSSLLRLSVGVEDPVDLENDLKQALDKIL